MSTLFNIGNKIATTTEALLPVQEATAGYSLRNIGIKGYNQPVVKVLRERDSAEEDFTSSEVSDGTLVDWVNGDDTIIYQSDFSSGADGFSSTRVNITANQTVAGESEVLKVTVGSVNNQLAYISKGMFSYFNKYTVTCKVYIPSGQTVDTLQIYTGYGTDVEGGSSSYRITTTDEWVTVNITFIPGTGATAGTDLRFWASDGDDLTLPSSAQGDVFYVKDIEVTRIGSLGQVKVWYDQFGDNNATQNTVSEMPKIVSFGALVTENGKPTLDFDGSDDMLIIPDFIYSTDAVSWINVVKPKQVSVQQVVFQHSETPSNRSWVYLFNNNNTFRFVLSDDGSTSNNIESSQTYSIQQYLWLAIFNKDESGTNDLFINYVNSNQYGYSEFENNNFSSLHNSTTDLEIGKGSLFIQEMILYDSDQSTNREAIENNINNYYNIYS